MSIFQQQTQLLTKIYPEHIWIDVDLSNLGEPPDWVKLNRACISTIAKYLTESLDLEVEPIFPSAELERSFVSTIVNGFVLLVSGVKVAFIPSLDLDLVGFEVQQEWVDLSRWMADYYVPVRIDLESNCLHLWGFISHQSLQQRSHLDRHVRSYEIESVDLIGDLDSLWTTCDLVANEIVPPERGKIPIQMQISHLEAVTLIDRLQQDRSGFSPRSILPFEKWGAIIDSPEYLTMYAHQKPGIIQISKWFQEITDRANDLVDRGWVKISEIFDKSQPKPSYLSGYMAAPAVKGISPGNDLEIHRAVRNLYISQNTAKKVDLPADIDSPLLLLTYLMQHTTDESLRWQAAEYLWTISPENERNWHRRIKDLGLVMQGHKLGLMVAAIPLIDGTYAILNRVYPIGTEPHLPPNVRLNLFAEDGDCICEVESRATVMDNYIQLYFTASRGDLFNIQVSMNEDTIVEAFAI
jgi:Protein of unknown function (DUF1822)